MSPSVNRYLEDKHFDRIDHALGRPVDPLAGTHRDYFAVEASSELADQFKASPHWECGTPNKTTGMAYFYVTGDGRQALADHLKSIGDRNKMYILTYQGRTFGVAATSAAKAKYSAFLDLSDCNPDLKFKDFVAEARAVSVKAPACRNGEAK